MITSRLLSIEVALLAGFGAIFLLPHSNNITPAGIAMTLPAFVGTWYGEDVEVTQREREALAKDTQFVRKTYFSPEGDQIFVSIVMSGDDMATSIHRPERCLPAQGWTLERSERRTVNLGDGKSLEMTELHDFQPVDLPDKSRQFLHNLNYYWFIGYDAMTCSHLVRTGIDLRDRILHGQAQRWAYVTVVTNVTKGWTRYGRSEEDATKMVEEFIRKLVPKLSRPDGSRLF